MAMERSSRCFEALWYERRRPLLGPEEKGPFYVKYPKLTNLPLSTSKGS